LKREFLESLEDIEVSETDAGLYFEDMIDAELHRGAIEEGKRADGRPLDAVRELFAKAGGVSPVLHGSGIFYRGGTHIFSALTLGGPEAAQMIDTIETPDTKKRFMHHYNFPPFSVGETGRIGSFQSENDRARGISRKSARTRHPTTSRFSVHYSSRL
jgi:polyribonucleotide nucleotidyltransferase